MASAERDAPALRSARAGRSRAIRDADAAISDRDDARRPSAAASTTTFVSLPVPSPCSTAIGQLAYASQCTARQAR